MKGRPSLLFVAPFGLALALVLHDLYQHRWITVLLVISFWTAIGFLGAMSVTVNCWTFALYERLRHRGSRLRWTLLRGNISHCVVVTDKAVIHWLPGKGRWQRRVIRIGQESR